jgi:NAD(P)-dependent dehydrogenase (short-subunit alcohol dehydrogenase family)
MVDDVYAEFGRLDFLVNNAGINRDGVIWKMTEEMWDTVLDTDLKGYFNYIHQRPAGQIRAGKLFRGKSGHNRIDQGRRPRAGQVLG